MTGKILGYRDLFKMDKPVWTNAMYKKLGRLPQDCKKHTGNDTIELFSTETNLRIERKLI